MSRRSRRRRAVRLPSSSGRTPWLVGALVALAVAVIGIWYVVSETSQESSDITLPAYVQVAPRSVKEAYLYAVERPDVLQYVPCYCGCGPSNGHRSNWHCFVQSMWGSDIVFDSHGSAWPMCVDIAREAKKLVAQGKDLVEVRRVVEEKYGSRGPATDTPMPPL